MGYGIHTSYESQQMNYLFVVGCATKRGRILIKQRSSYERGNFSKSWRDSSKGIES